MARMKAQDKLATELRTGDADLLQSALLALYQKQTSGEKHVRRTYKRNGVGFDRNMAPAMSRVAELALSGNLTGKHLRVVRNVLPGYATQLRDLALKRGLRDDV